MSHVPMNRQMKKNRGFTLIEIMITVAIIAILAAIAFPAFESQTRKSNRAAAQAAMMDIANKEQLYLPSARSYTATLSDLGYTVPGEVSRFYDVVVTVDNTATPPSFLITATPKSGTKQVPDGPLTVASNGDKKRNGDATQW